jgi:Carboxypeptidase regulatory-like domain
VDTTGDVDLFNAAGSVNAAIDIEGWFQFTYGIFGTVLDSRTPAQPVIGATVTYAGTAGGGSTTTDNNGDYAFDNLPPGTYTLTVSDYGYTAQSTQTVTVASGSLVSASLVIRDPFRQPFTSTSIWNMPIGSGAQYEPANLIPAQKKTLVSDQHIIVMTPTAPLTQLQKSLGAQFGDRCTSTGTTLATIPIPADFTVQSSKSNNPIAAVEADGHTLIEGEPFARCTAGGPGTVWFDEPNPGDLYGDGLVGVDGGSNLSSLGGAVRLGELVKGGVITHALQIDVDAPNLYPGDTSGTTCYRWPATKCDTTPPAPYTGTNPELRMGALLALPPTLDLTTLGLQTQPGVILATALQDYGAYVANDAARSVNNIVTEFSPSGSILPIVDSSGAVVDPGEFQTVWGFPFETALANGTDPWSQDIATIFAHLDIVTDNGPTSIGGGGTPLAPLLPPL